MSLCKYAFYKEEEKYYPRLYCKTDDKWCPYTRRCQKVEKFIPIEDDIWEECGKYIMEKRKEIPVGANFVQTSRTNRQGKLLLYVVLDDDKVKRIETNLKEIKQEYVYLKKTSNGYDVSLEPFKEEPKKVSNNNITIYINEELATEKKEKRGRKKKVAEEVKEENE